MVASLTEIVLSLITEKIKTFFESGFIIDEEQAKSLSTFFEENFALCSQTSPLSPDISDRLFRKAKPIVHSSYQLFYLLPPHHFPLSHMCLHDSEFLRSHSLNEISKYPLITLHINISRSSQISSSLFLQLLRSRKYSENMHSLAIKSSRHDSDSDHLRNDLWGEMPLSLNEQNDFKREVCSSFSASFANLAHLDLSCSPLCDAEAHTLFCSSVFPAPTRLKFLNLSNTSLTHFSFLPHFAHSLQHLVLHNNKTYLNPQQLLSISSLTSLCSLDLLEEDLIVNRNKSSLKSHSNCPFYRFLTSCHLPCIRFLDISGSVTFLTSQTLLYILKSNKFPVLKFLGLFASPDSSSPAILSACKNYGTHKSDLVVTGENDVTQILTSFQQYSSLPLIILECFNTVVSKNIINADILSSVCDSTRRYLNTHYSFSQKALDIFESCISLQNVSQYPSHLLDEIMAVLIAILESRYLYDAHISQEIILFAHDTNIIHYATQFDCFTFAQLIFDWLCIVSQPYELNNYWFVVKPLFIIQYLATRIDNSKIQDLGAKPSYISYIFSLLKPRVSLCLTDEVVVFSMAVLWNLSDESPFTCHNIVEAGAVDLYLKAFSSYADKPFILSKFVGSLSNIVEVRNLVPFFTFPEFFNHLKLLMHKDYLPISYFACASAAHIVAYERSTELSPLRQELSDVLTHTVLQWTSTVQEIVTYRTFRSFRHLLLPNSPPASVLWALWALTYLVKINAPKYTVLMRNEGIFEEIELLNSRKDLESACHLFLTYLDASNDVYHLAHSTPSQQASHPQNRVQEATNGDDEN